MAQEDLESEQRPHGVAEACSAALVFGDHGSDRVAIQMMKDAGAVGAEY
jgi:hypothetical protein